ncbi:MAG: UDP-N-acetylglucosamine 1-carboxyvinyltransferase [Bradymonadales bacterium]|nr:UDP-N-acetylglucosamine 1-carboxyvinyltransferase [Bradymonadales bacterium]
MDKFVITGGKRLAGDFFPSGSKNEALPAISAALLTDQEVILDNIPHIRDVEVMVQLVERLGAEVRWIEHNRLSIKAAQLEGVQLDPDLCQRARASILFAGPMLARAKEVLLPPPGGDVIGRRRLDTHILGLQALGARFDYDNTLRFQAPQLSGADIFLDEASVTATENIIMAAVLARGTTVIRNAACEPHVQGLCRMLTQMGARIEGIGSNTLIIDGVKGLWGGHHTIGPDYLEIGSMIGLASITNSDVTLCRVRPDELRMILMVFEKLGISAEIGEDRIRIAPNQPLEIRSDFLNEIPKIDDAPWPAFPTDLMSIAITVATQAKGAVLFFEKMFDGRMFFTDHLIAMGARIILCDPHRIVVVGPSQLVGARVESPDVRAGMALLIAALCARGDTTIFNIRQIDRGYERIDQKLNALGADIKRLPVNS